MQQADFIWMNGELVRWEDAKVHVLTHALHYGSGVFEGIRAYETERGTAVFRHGDHLDRLKRSAELYYMDLPFTLEKLREATHELIRVNKLRSCYIRPVAFRGYGEMGLFPLNAPVDIFIAVWPWGAYLGEEGQKHGIRCKVSSWRRMSDASFIPEAKACGQYLSSILGAWVIKSNGYHEALFLDDHGHVSEGSGENFFVVQDDVVYTPDSSSSILEGITRDSVMQIARDMGHKVVERKLTMGDVFAADEAFFTGTAAEVTPIREVENRPVGDGEPGPVTKRIQETYFKAVRGQDDRYQHWLTRVA